MCIRDSYRLYRQYNDYRTHYHYHYHYHHYSSYYHNTPQQRLVYRGWQNLLLL